MENGRICIEKGFRDLEDKFLKTSRSADFGFYICSIEQNDIILKFKKLCPARSTQNNIIAFFRLLEELVEQGYLCANYERYEINKIGNCKGNK